MRTDNDLIADFMGLIPNEYSPGEYSKPEEYMETESGKFGWWETPKYDTSWDWLMPVVEKIGKLYEANFPKGDEFMRRILAHEDPIEKEYVDIISTSIYTPINEVFDEVVKFIKWYNTKS